MVSYIQIHHVCEHMRPCDVRKDRSQCDYYNECEYMHRGLCDVCEYMRLCDDTPL